jgi:hypothetical protein
MSGLLFASLSDISSVLAKLVKIESEIITLWQTTGNDPVKPPESDACRGHGIPASGYVSIAALLLCERYTG